MEDYDSDINKWMAKNLTKTGWFDGGNFMECCKVAQEHVKSCLEKSSVGDGDLMSTIFDSAKANNWSQELCDLSSIYGMHKQGIISDAEKKKKLNFSKLSMQQILHMMMMMMMMKMKVMMMSCLQLKVFLKLAQEWGRKAMILLKNNTFLGKPQSSFLWRRERFIFI